MKTTELSGAALDWAVAKAEGFFNIGMASVGRNGVTDVFYFDKWEPSTIWEQAGVIVEREKLGVWWATHVVDDDGVEYGNHWYCETGCTDDNPNDSYHIATGATPLEAAMRCYVMTKLGYEVEIPEEI